MKTGPIMLEPHYQARLTEIIHRTMIGSHGKIALFGSRAQGKARNNSDIDLAVSVDISKKNLIGKLREEIENSIIPFTVDVIDLETCSPDLAAKVAKEGILIWSA
jgi:uncharacterized protein